MDSTALRSAYRDLLVVAAEPGLGAAADGGWDADHVLAHVLSVDAAVAAVALGVLAGARPAFDNRVSLDRWNLDRIIGEHTGRAELAEHIRVQAQLLCDLADRLPSRAAAVAVPVFLMSNDELAADQPMSLEALLGGLADNHVPGHARQLRALRPVRS